MSNAQREKLVFGLIMLDLIKTSNFQKAGTKTAQLRQDVVKESYYASKQASDSLTESLYPNEAFGFGENKFEATEHRVVFMNIPTSETEEGLKAKLAAVPNARIRKFISNHPILSDSQKNSIKRGLKTMDDYANRQVVRYPAGHPQAGQIILINGKVNYKVTKFNASGAADIDTRTSDPADYYVSETIAAELSGEMVIDAEYSELVTTPNEEAIRDQVM